VTRLALIGLGRWGTNIARTLQELPECRLEYVCDPTATAVGEAQILRDWHELLDKKLDGVLVATPGTTHFDIARPFIEQGIATFIEKPLTTKLAEAEQLQQVAHKHGTIVMVGHVHLYNLAWQRAKEVALEAGAIRQIMTEGMNNGPYRDDMSALWDWAPHDVALILDLVQAMPQAVQAWGFRPLNRALHDTVIFKLTFPNNLETLSLVSWLAPEKRKKVTIIGEKDAVVFDDTAEKKVILYQGMSPTIKDEAVTRQEPQLSYPEYVVEPPLQRELAAFIEAITTKAPPLANIDHGVEVIKIIAAAEHSLALDGKPINL
jgi:UDP-N-acetylglucosamine 3-dehydrogenase